MSSLIPLFFILNLFLSSSTPEALGTPDKNVKDVTSKIEVLGSPFSKPVYARNVWDMQVFDGKIYLGHGNSSNEGPSPNAGPTPIYYYDPVGNKFASQNVISSASSEQASSTKEYVDEEQIDIFKVLNGKLYIPGNDARDEGWEFGNYYKLEGNEWIKYRNVPNGIHVYDMAYYEGKLFVAIGTDSTPDVLMSEDDGLTWTKIGSIGGKNPPRAYTLFEFKKKLFAVSTIAAKNNKWPDEAKILSIKGEPAGAATKFETSQITVYGDTMLPGITKNVIKYEPSPYMKMVRTTQVNDKLLYIAGGIFNDHQWIPQCLIVANDINDVQRVNFPRPDALPMDILVRDNTVYVLAYTQTSPGQYTNTVYKTSTTDLMTWTELFEFNQDAFARSFEELNGDFYFGLGSNIDYAPETTGTIIKVNKSDY
ncbi:hypothetical protein [Paenibacillus sedimenti]|uniref:Exo-alpha-sialidase n=1 Tax=Paenibacillus sedimenti TaxID=2770274 RepID=A0A926QIQ0_9BACL|nr:hypothetical protein [Paenibacillus sedimenti]MBD0379734.1 hypothetical protein [Paenibacillus sedimenti]